VHVSGKGSWVAALTAHPETTDPTIIIGPLFAELCVNKDNAVVILYGSKMFHLALDGVKHYLPSVALIV
jgi:hypothetical protein